MSEKYVPKVGDEVEAVVRGKVTCVSKDGIDVQVDPSDDDGTVALVPIASYGSLKKVEPPLPTAHGSVIRYRFADSEWGTLILDGDRQQWRTAYGDAITSDPRAAFPNVEVVFDAGAVK